MTPARPSTVTASFDDFVHATARTMHGTALLLTGGDHHLAQDLTQATYTKVFMAWRRISGLEDPVAYTRQVLTRTYLSHRRLRRNSERPADVLVDRPGVDGPDAAVRLDLIAALGTLRAGDRVVLVLRYWLDLSVTQTAVSLGISEAAVRQRARRALVRLREQFPDLELDPSRPNHDSQPQEQR
ncbi:sigma-70 family RNA polymerase sigma factor [Nocardioides hwasunensis]|nr:sigma-70 family RNA polymerase sigma factor [Nocardioides hwasunensis]